MIRRRRKQDPTQRSPHLQVQRQSTFHYSSNRAQAEKTRDRKVFEEGQPSRGQLLKKKLLKIPYAGSVTALILLGFYMSSLSGKTSIEISNPVNLREKSVYNQESNRLAAQGLLGKSKLTFNRQSLEAGMTQKFPEISFADVKTPWFSRTVVAELSINEPVIFLSTANGKFYLNDSGIVLLEARDASPAFKPDNLIKMEDQSGLPLTPGKPALTKVQVTFISELKRQSEAKKLLIENTSLVAGGGEASVAYRGLPYRVKYNLYEDARKSFGTYYAVKEQLDKARTVPAEYVDVRVPERAYVK